MVSMCSGFAAKFRFDLRFGKANDRLVNGTGAARIQDCTRALCRQLCSLPL